MLLTYPNKILGDRENMCFLRIQVRRGLWPPLGRPTSSCCACQDACTHPKIAEASVRREVYQGDTFVKDPPSWEFLLPRKVKRRCY